MGEALQLNPKLIMVRVSGYGQTGPYRDLPGFGVIGEAMGGLRYLNGEPGRPPVRCGISIGDSISALYAVIGVLLALHHRNQHGGKGQCIDVALYESVFGMMESLIPEYDYFGYVREPSGSALPGIAPTNAYRTARWKVRSDRRQRRRHFQTADERDRTRRSRQCRALCA